MQANCFRRISRHFWSRSARETLTDCQLHQPTLGVLAHSILERVPIWPFGTDDFVDSTSSTQSIVEVTTLRRPGRPQSIGVDPNEILDNLISGDA